MSSAHEILGYTVLATLGHGARSTIFAVRDKKNQVFALKRVIKEGPSDQRFLDQAISEHEICQKFDHPCIRKSYKLIKQRALIRTSEVYVLMEMVDGLTLEQYKPKSMIELCRIVQVVADGLSVMHEKGYLHCDIKPNNIMVTQEPDINEAAGEADSGVAGDGAGGAGGAGGNVGGAGVFSNNGTGDGSEKKSKTTAGSRNGTAARSDGRVVSESDDGGNPMIHQVKLIDLGQSCPDNTVKERIQGTPDYIAPEQVKRRRLTPRTDIFNLGATMYWLATRQHIPTMMPKRKNDSAKAGERAIDDDLDMDMPREIRPPMELNPEIPPALSSLILNCVAKSPSDRPESMALVRDRLEMAIAQMQRETTKPRRIMASSTKSNGQSSSESSRRERRAV